MLLESQSIDEFEIEEIIGEGAFGRVYRAYDNILDRPVAIKELRERYSLDNEVILRFIQEIKVLSKIFHQNIVAFYGYRIWDKRLFLITEYIPGGNLRNFLQRNKRISLDQIIDIGIQICDGLLAIQDLGITHRDIKPENILMTYQSEVKISDFGISFLPIPLGGYENIEKGKLIGTPLYMSPIQLKGDFDFNSDAYATGAILFELLTDNFYVKSLLEYNGYNIFEIYSPQNLINSILSSHKKPFPIYTTKYDIPDWLNETIYAAIDNRISIRALRENLSTRSWFVDNLRFENPILTPCIRSRMHTPDLVLQKGIKDIMDIMVWKKTSFCRGMFIYLSYETNEGYNYLTKNDLQDLQYTLDDAWAKAYTNLELKFDQYTPHLIRDSKKEVIMVAIEQEYSNAASFVLLKEALVFFLASLQTHSCIIGIPHADAIIATKNTKYFRELLQQRVSQKLFLHRHPISDKLLTANLKNNGEIIIR